MGSPAGGYAVRGFSNPGPTTGTVEIPKEPKAAVFWLEIGEPGRGKTIALADNSAVTIGTHDACDIVLRDRTVSGRHCNVSSREGRLWVEDLGSRNGVYLGGGLVAKACLVPGACFVVGGVTVGVRAGLHQRVPESQHALPGVIGTSAVMLQMGEQVRRLARTSIPVLVRGPTGSGKELVARALHELGPRCDNTFLAINAGALPRDLASAELFGHERGAYTGAHARRDGAFVLAQGGTLFLDEVGELGPDIQVKLLRVLEEGEVHPLGAAQPVRVNVRVVAATWSPLEVLVAEGKFREDLYHRLAVASVRVPALSDRRGDIAALAEHFLRASADEVGRKQMSPAALATLAAQRWPGNVRQLRNIVLRAALATADKLISASDVESAVHVDPVAAVRMSPEAAAALVASCKGSVTAAARMCAAPRSTFRGWLRGLRSAPASGSD